MKLKNSLVLFLASFIWGTAFVAQRMGMDHMEPISFNGIRSFIGFLSLFCVILLRKMILRKKGRQDPFILNKKLLLGGLVCGFFLFAASVCQQIGIKYTGAGKSAFITAFYIILVPVLAVFLRKPAGKRVWISVFIALAGLYLLSVKDDFSIASGDIFLFACAFLYACQILSIDHFAPELDSLSLSCIQFLTAGILSVPFMLAEKPAISQVFSSLWPLLYAGVMSSGVAYTCQIIGQKDMDPSVASLIMSFESVFSLLAGWIILHEHLSFRELIGCALMLTAILLSQLPGNQDIPVENAG